MSNDDYDYVDQDSPDRWDIAASRAGIPQGEERDAWISAFMYPGQLEKEAPIWRRFKLRDGKRMQGHQVAEARRYSFGVRDNRTRTGEDVERAICLWSVLREDVKDYRWLTEERGLNDWMGLGLSPRDANRWALLARGIGEAKAALGVGITLDMAREWRRHGFKLDEIPAWRKNGLRPAQAAAWSKKGVAAGAAGELEKRAVHPSEVPDVVMRACNSSELVRWIEFSGSPGTAAEWSRKGYTFSEACLFKGFKISPAEGFRWHQIGVRPPMAKRLLGRGMSIGDAERWPWSVSPVEDAFEWLAKGFVFDEALTWARFRVPLTHAHRLVQEGFTVHHAVALFSNGYATDVPPLERRLLEWVDEFGVDKTCAWIRALFTFEDARKWNDVGHTPESARRLRGLGYTSETAPK